MSLYTDPDERNGHPLDMVETFIAREHWEPILRLAAVNGMIMGTVTLLLGLDALPGLAIIHIITFATAMAQGFLALRLDESGQEDAAVAVGRRSMAAFLLAGVTLLLMPFAV